MSCYTTYDANGNPIHNYTGNVTLDLTSASNGGAGYVAPACNDPPPATVTEQLPAYTIHTSLSGGPVVPPEFSWAGAPAMLAVAVMVLLMLRGRQIKPSGG
jgi:hypothetical protein